MFKMQTIKSAGVTVIYLRRNESIIFFQEFSRSERCSQIYGCYEKAVLSKDKL